MTDDPHFDSFEFEAFVGVIGLGRLWELVQQPDWTGSQDNHSTMLQMIRGYSNPQQVAMLGVMAAMIGLLLKDEKLTIDDLKALGPRL